jgi:predicted DNA-binding transcriptional regulator YafY
MPLSKNAFTRYRIINGLLSSSRRYSLKELAEKVNEQLVSDGFSSVTERMIYKDIADMQTIYPVIVRKKSGKYYYEDRDESIENIPLSDEDKKILEMALQTFSLYKGSPFFDKFNNTINRLMAGSVLRKLHKGDPSFHIQIGEMLGDTGQRWLEIIYEAIIDKKCLKMYYKPYGLSTKMRTISPYLLKEYRNKWYLVAYANEIKETGSTNVFKLHRIEKIENSDSIYFDDPKFSKDEYFKHSLGVFHQHDQSPAKVTLCFKKQLIPLILENPLHPTMKILEHSDELLRVEIEVYNTIELKNMILSFGEHVNVEAPAFIVKEIKQAIHHMYDSYNF